LKKFINQDEMKRMNLTDVFRFIKGRRQTTRKTIEAATGLSWGAVSKIAARLIETGFVTERKPADGAGVGRTPSFLEINGGGRYAVGLDINMTGMTAALLNLRNEQVRKWRGDADYTDRDTLLASIKRFARGVFEDAGQMGEVVGTGVAMQGVVDAENGVSARLPQCAGWQNVRLAEILQAEFRVPTYLEHDPNCVLIAESERRKLGNAVLLRIDKGVGMAVMLGGRVIGGVGLFEIGHTAVVPDGLPCACGGRGCLEIYASISGFERQFGAPFVEIVSRARSGGGAALALFDGMAARLGAAIRNAACLFNAGDVFLCGEMTECADLFLEKARRVVRESGFGGKARFTLTDVENAAFGAALVAIDKAVNNIQI
jgi:predicted NBD/HSP70 family sugar kinase